MKTLEKNMAVLWAVAPETARWINRSCPGPSWEFICRDGQHDNLVLPASSGEKSFLHDPDEPEDAERIRAGDWAARLKTKTGLVVGVGLGRRLAALAAAVPPDVRLLAVEENPALVKAALERRDFSTRLATGKLIFIPGSGPALGKFGASMMKSIQAGESTLLVDENCRRFFSASFSQTVLDWERSAGIIAIKTQAAAQGAAMLATNEMVNLPLSLLSPDISRLKNILAGTPALVVSAGPSLENALPRLGRAAEKAAVIAAAPVLRSLLAHGLSPHLVGILDYGTSNHEVLLDVFASDVPLAFLEGTFPQVQRDYQGELVSVLHDRGSTFAWLGPHLGDRDPRPSGTNVGSFCLHLAVYLGADPIILVGQDLSFPDPASHSEGVVGRKRLKISANDPHAIMLPSTAGGLVPSNLTLASFLEEFTLIIKNAGRRVINTSPGGARIPGTLEMPLEEALEQAGNASDRRERLAAALKPGRWDFPTLSALVAKQARDLEAIAGLAAQAGRLAVQAVDLAARVPSPRDQAWQTLVQAQMACGAKAEAHLKTFPPLRNYLAGQGPAPPPVPGRDWRRDAREFFQGRAARAEALHKGARTLSETLTRSGRELSAGWEARAIEDREERGVDELCSAAQAFVSLGRMRKALALFREALARDPGREEIAVAAAGAALALERLDLARDIIDALPPETRNNPQPALVGKKIETLARTWLCRAEEKLALGDMTTAILLTRKVLDFAPDDPPALAVRDKCEKLRRERLSLAAARDREYYRRKQQERPREPQKPGQAAPVAKE
ncbi:MAG: 6-hydroxymethylpterin diphosphokinase MptE-like protein [Pseudomonadota bacterium]